MTDDLLSRLADAGADVQAPSDLEARAAARYRVHTRRRRAAAGAGVAAVLAVGALAVPSVLDALRPAEAPVIGEGDALPTPTATPTFPRERNVGIDVMPHVDLDAVPVDGGSWEVLPPFAPDGLQRTHAAVWADDRLIVVAGDVEVGGDPFRLHVLDPTTETWTEVPTPEGDGRSWDHVLWTGDQLVVLGGAIDEEPDPDIPPTDPTVAGYAWAPATGDWTVVPPAPLAPRLASSAVWTGAEVVVWGGLEPPTTDAAGTSRQPGLADGAALDPTTGTWRPIADAPIAGRGEHGAVWNGHRMVVFAGGSAAAGYESEGFLTETFDDAAVYDPTTDAWATIASPGLRGPVVAAVWTGSEVVTWTNRIGADAGMSAGLPGIVWDPTTGERRELQEPPFGQHRDTVEAVWAPELGDVVVFGGSCGEGCNRAYDDGARVDVATGSWSASPPLDGATGHGPRVAWDGTRLLVVGGTTDPQGDPSSTTGRVVAWVPR
ncbi:MAG: hypothetical protein ACLGIR_00635 [Actinomycetes bacterium]